MVNEGRRQNRGAKWIRIHPRSWKTWRRFTATASSAGRAPFPGSGPRTCARTSRPRSGRRSSGAGGAVGRGPRRWYVEIHPQNLRGFAELAEPPVGHGHVRGRSRHPLRDRRGRLRHPVSGRQEPAVASGFPVADRQLERPAHHLAGVQPDRRRRHIRYGAVRGRSGNAMGRWARVETRDVPRDRGLAEVPGARGPQVPADGRHLLQVGSDGASWNRSRVADRPARAGAGRRRAGSGSLRRCTI